MILTRNNKIYGFSRIYSVIAGIAVVGVGAFPFERQHAVLRESFKDFKPTLSTSH